LFSSSVMLGNIDNQISVTTSYNSPLTENGSSWAPAQAKSEGTKAFFQLWLCFPPRGKGKSETVYRDLRPRGTHLDMRMISPPIFKLLILLVVLLSAVVRPVFVESLPVSLAGRSLIPI
jgi:hypothetical protein